MVSRLEGGTQYTAAPQSSVPAAPQNSVPAAPQGNTNATNATQGTCLQQSKWRLRVPLRPAANCLATVDSWLPGSRGHWNEDAAACGQVGH